jgi:hypothetical protein
MVSAGLEAILDRRHFLKSGAKAAGMVSMVDFPHRLYAQDTRKSATDRIKRGPMGVEVSRLAMGSGTNGGGGSSNQTKKLGVQGLADHFRAGYDQGVTFFDTADHYGTHPNVKLAIKGLPREKVTLPTKTHASTGKEMKVDLDLLFHFMHDDDRPDCKKGSMAVISEAREKGIVRTHGTSCRTLGASKAAGANPWVQVDLARTNSVQAQMDADPATLLSVLKQ